MFNRSERLFLRPSWPEDWEELYPLIADRGIVRNLASAPWPFTPSDAREFTCREQVHMLPHFLVTLPTVEGSKIIGTVGLSGKNGQAELGYWIAREHWGRGYASEAAGAVLRLAGALGHRRVVAGHFVDNPASGRVLVKAGFCPTGESRQQYSRGRGHAAQSVEYAAELGETGSADEDDDTNGPFDRIAA
jgi:RimJ/RimL family protein N-acetyltransferase